MNGESHIKLSRYLSYILRHKPDDASIRLDLNGWVEVSKLIDGINSTGRSINYDILREIVDSDSKQRYSLSEDKTLIRANQGHSIDVNIDLKVTKPPMILYHGTAQKFVDSIMERGILKQKRNHVHLTGDYDTATKVGSRHGISVVLSIRSVQMYNDGYIFYLSENNIWLTEEVPYKYISLA